MATGGPSTSTYGLCWASFRLAGSTPRPLIPSTLSYRHAGEHCDGRRYVEHRKQGPHDCTDQVPAARLPAACCVERPRGSLDPQRRAEACEALALDCGQPGGAGGATGHAAPEARPTRRPRRKRPGSSTRPRKTWTGARTCGWP
jgi:hypothetical protein